MREPLRIIPHEFNSYYEYCYIYWMWTDRQEELLLKGKLKTQQRVISFQQMKMEMTAFDKIFMDTVTILDQTRPLKLPYIKKRSGPEEFHSSRSSNHNNSQIIIGKEKEYIEKGGKKDRSSSLISDAIEKENLKKNNDKSLENNKTMMEEVGARDESLKKQKKGLPKIIKNKYFKEFSEKMERIMSERNVARVTETIQQPRYKLGSVLGQGAYATVRLAKSDTGQLVAIKCYDKVKINENQKLQNIKREIQILRKIKHPFIIELVDVTENDTHINIVTELIENLSMLDLMKLSLTSRLTQFEAKPLFKELCQALFYLHNKNIVHRDIKLENILITKQKHVKLIDFGFSTEIHTHPLTTFCGTPSYISPEMISKKGYGKSVDIWSLGVTLFKMITGHFPFKAVSHKSLYAKILKGNFKFSNDISINAQILITKMLCIDPSSRVHIQQVLKEPWFSQ